MEMKKNVGQSDRYVRFMIGLGFIMSIFSLEPSKFGAFVLLALGLLVWNTVLNSYCFLYDILNINTAEKAPKPAEPAQETHSH
jgi:hypothetical protein